MKVISCVNGGLIGISVGGEMGGDDPWRLLFSHLALTPPWLFFLKVMLFLKSIRGHSITLKQPKCILGFFLSLDQAYFATWAWDWWLPLFIVVPCFLCIPPSWHSNLWMEGFHVPRLDMSFWMCLCNALSFINETGYYCLLCSGVNVYVGSRMGK